MVIFNNILSTSYGLTPEIKSKFEKHKHKYEATLHGDNRFYFRTFKKDGKYYINFGHTNSLNRWENIYYVISEMFIKVHTTGFPLLNKVEWEVSYDKN